MCACHLPDLCIPGWHMAGTNRVLSMELISEHLMDIQSTPKAPLGSVISGSLLLNLLSLFFFTVFCLFFFKGSHNQQKKILFLGDGHKLKDWHDKEAIRRDAQRVGTCTGRSRGEGSHVCVCARVCGHISWGVRTSCWLVSVCHHAF